MAHNTKTDSLISRRIVLSFLDFLNSVEPAPGVELEGLEVAKDCLSEVFQLNPSPGVYDGIKPNSLFEIFSKLEASKQQNEFKSELSHEEGRVDAPSSSYTVQNAAHASHPETLKSVGDDDWTRKPSTSGVSKDELFGQFFDALEKINFLMTSVDGIDDQAQLDKATCLFENALTDMERSGCQSYNRNNLAESLKTQGNKAMQSKLYSDAIELYTCAIALLDNNAIYYCNRAAAFTQIKKYNEAIRDCYKSIEMDPSYRKAYSRLGSVYYAQGEYRAAIKKGFNKALMLDPTNESVKENIRACERKLLEGLQDGLGQIASLPAELTEMLMDVPVPLSEEDCTYGGDGSDNPEIRVGGVNMNFNSDEQPVPEHLTVTLRSVLSMLTRATSSPPQGSSPSTPN